MTRADRTAAAAAQQSTFELLCWSFWDIVGEQILNIYLVNIHCFLTQECYHKKYMCRRAGPGRAATGCTQKSIHSLAAKQTLISTNNNRFFWFQLCRSLQRFVASAATHPPLSHSATNQKHRIINFLGGGWDLAVWSQGHGSSGHFCFLKLYIVDAKLSSWRWMIWNPCTLIIFIPFWSQC